MKAWQVGVTNVGATSSATMAWRSGGQLRLTVIVKSVFRFAPNDSMRIAPAEDILDTDVPLDVNSSHGSLRGVSDRYPFRPRVDVIFFGHAYAPGGRPAKRISARMAIANGNDKLLDKVIDVIGDRSHPAADPIPFMKMPLVYERAYGGHGFAPNPVGRGFGPNAHVMPNIVFPYGWQRDTEPASLGPVAASSPHRLRLVGHKPLDFLTQTVTEIPPQLDVSYFQCAPEDQRIAQLQGGEWLLLENLHPTHPQLMTRLPDVQGAAMLFGKDGSDISIPLRADTLIIDGDRELCIVVCRGSHPVPNEAALDTLRIAAGVETNRTPIDWSDAKKRATATSDATPGTALLDPNAAIVFKTPYAIAEPAKEPAQKDASLVTTPVPGAPFTRSAAHAPALIPPINPGAATFVAAAPPQTTPPASFASLWGVRPDAQTLQATTGHGPGERQTTAAETGRIVDEHSASASLGAAALYEDSSRSQSTSPADTMQASDSSFLSSADEKIEAAVATTETIATTDTPPQADTGALLGQFGASPPEVLTTKQWSWANSEMLGSSAEHSAAPRAREAERPAEPPPRALIYSGFARKK